MWFFLFPAPTLFSHKCKAWDTLPFPLLLSWQGSQAPQPGACGDLGPVAAQGRKKEEAGPPFLPLLFPPSPSTSPSLWFLNAEGEQRVLFEKARDWDRVGVVGNQPGLPLPPSQLLEEAWLPPPNASPSPNSHDALFSHVVMGWSGGEADHEAECGEWDLFPAEFSQ